MAESGQKPTNEGIDLETITDGWILLLASLLGRLASFSEAPYYALLICLVKKAKAMFMNLMNRRNRSVDW